MGFSCDNTTVDSRKRVIRGNDHLASFPCLWRNTPCVTENTFRSCLQDLRTDSCSIKRRPYFIQGFPGLLGLSSVEVSENNGQDERHGGARLVRAHLVPVLDRAKLVELGGGNAVASFLDLLLVVRPVF